MNRLAVWLSIAAAVSVMFSNALCQVLLGAALLMLLVARRRLDLPPVRLPLALFFAGTLLALALSPDPGAGLPQVKKFYVFTMLAVLYSALPGTAEVRTILVSWAILGTASGLWSFVQFFRKRAIALASGDDLYLTYVARRVTGFMSHWMTFSAEQMIAGLMLGSLLLFGALKTRRPLWAPAIWWAGMWWTGIAIIGASVLIAWTRSVWIGTAVGVCYLIAVWRPKLLLAAPLAAALLWVLAPEGMRERVTSVYRPHGETDSNEHRRITFLTGVEMVKAHPWFGLGPEIPGREFERYVPADIARPLPTGFYGHLHNVYLQYAAERGIPTLLAFLWFIGKVLADFWLAVRKLAASEALRRAILHGAVASILGLLIEGLFEHNFGDSEVLTMFLIIVASGYIAARARERGDDIPVL